MNIIRKLFEPVDMTQGTPWKKILTFSIPLLLGNFAQQMYNTVDTIVVGQILGDNALAAVGICGPILNLLICLFVGIGQGASISVSQYRGAKDRKGLSWTIGNSIILILIASAIVMVAGYFLTPTFLRLINTPDDLMPMCISYLRIMFLGGAGLAFYNILNGILQGLGDSMSALLYLLLSTVLNIFMDILLVKYTPMGVGGAALATIIAQAISALLCLRRLFRLTYLFDMSREYIRYQSFYIGRILKLGVPSGITQAIFSCSMLIVQSLTNSFGAQFIAANVITMRVDGFAMLPNMSFGTAMTTYSGQNAGAGRIDRIHEGTKQGLILSTIITASITGLILIFGRQLMGIFTNTEELVDLSMQLMKILAVGYVIMTVLQVMAGVMRGAGDTTTPMWVSIFQTLVVRVCLAYLLVYLSKTPKNPAGNPLMIYYSMLISWTFGALLNLFFFKKGKWRKRLEAQISSAAQTIS